MPFVNVPGAYQVNVKQRLDNQLVENVFGVRSDDGESPLSMPAIADAFKTWWQTSLAPQLSTAISLVEIDVRDLSSEAAGGYVLTVTPPVTGTNGGAPAPNNVALAISQRTAQAGRSFRGRTYVAGLAKDAIAGNAINPGIVSDIVTAFNQLRTVLEALNAVLVVISRIHNGVERLTGLTTVVVASTAVDNIVDSQRRRLPGRGR